MSNTTENELKTLILDEDFTRIQSLVNEEVNLMDILGVSNKELPHSNFLAWFFNANESHNLGDYALKEFIKIYFQENQLSDLGSKSSLSVFDFALMDFQDLEVRREHKNIDLILISPKNELCIIVENKIKSTEQNNQLIRYKKYIETESVYKNFKYKIYIYLSLDNQQIDNEDYIEINYENIIKLIDRLLSNQKINIADKTKFVFQQYLQTLKSMTNQNEQIEIIAKNLYNKYKSAFDLVFKYASPEDNGEVWNKIKFLVDSESSIKPYICNKNYIRFQPKYLHENINEFKKVGLILMDDDLTDNWTFLFEFELRNGRVNFNFKIGKGDNTIRNKLYEMYERNSHIFTKVKKQSGLSSMWHQSFQKQILSPHEMQQFVDNMNDEQNTMKLIEERFNDLIKYDLPKIIGCIDDEIKSM